MDNIESKQALLRERISEQSYNVYVFYDYINAQKGIDLNNYTYKELTQVIDNFIEERRQEKQSYLRENILEKNYDIQEFLNYISNQKIDGKNIDNWSFEDLQEIVSQFQTAHKVQQQDEFESKEEQTLRMSKMQDFLNTSTMKQQVSVSAEQNNYTLEEGVDFSEQQQQFSENNDLQQQMRRSLWSLMKNKNLKKKNIQNDSNYDNEQFNKTPKSFKKQMSNIMEENSYNNTNAKSPSISNMSDSASSGFDMIQQQQSQQQQFNFQQQQQKEQNQQQQSNSTPSQKENSSQCSQLEDDFNSSQQQQSQKTDEEDQEEDEDLDEQNFMKQKKFTNTQPFLMVNNQGQELVQQYLYKELECVKEASRYPKKNKLKIQITGWETQKGGFFGFSGKSVVYNIVVQPFKWNVKRQIKDFINLRKILIKLFPGKFIPPLDNNTSESSDQEIRKRIQYLTTFCQHISGIEEVWSNVCTITFFSDQEKWDPLAGKAREQVDPKRAIASMNGKLQIRVAQENHIYKGEVYKFIQKAEQEFSDLQIQTSRLVDDFKKLSDSLNKINQNHQNLINQITNFNIQLTQKLPQSEELQSIIGNNDYLQKTYKHMSNLISSMSKSTRQHGQLIDNLENHFKFQKNCLNSSKGLIKQCQEHEDTYLNYKLDIDRQLKQNPHLRKTPKIIGEEIYLEENYGYWSQSAHREIQDLLNIQAEDYVQFFNFLTRFETLRINELVKSFGKTVDEYFENPLPIPVSREITLQQSIQKKQNNEQNI